jgi:hypothetical protein
MEAVYSHDLTVQEIRDAATALDQGLYGDISRILEDGPESDEIHTHISGLCIDTSHMGYDEVKLKNKGFDCMLNLVCDIRDKIKHKDIKVIDIPMRDESITKNLMMTVDILSKWIDSGKKVLVTSSTTDRSAIVACVYMASLKKFTISNILATLMIKRSPFTEMFSVYTAVSFMRRMRKNDKEAYFTELTQKDYDAGMKIDNYSLLVSQATSKKLCADPKHISLEMWIDTNNTAMDNHKLQRLGIARVLNCGPEELHHNDVIVENIHINPDNLMDGLAKAVKLLSQWYQMNIKNYDSSLKILVTSPTTDISAAVIAMHIMINVNIPSVYAIRKLIQDGLTPFSDTSMILTLAALGYRHDNCDRSNIMAMVCPIHERYHHFETISSW